MTDKELRRLSRADLVDVIYRLRLENAELEQRLQECHEKLNEKTIVIENAGSIANAALALNGVFEKAQKAADQYVLSVKAMYAEKMEQQLLEMRKQCGYETEDGSKGRDSNAEPD